MGHSSLPLAHRTNGHQRSLSLQTVKTCFITSEDRKLRGPKPPSVEGRMTLYTGSQKPALHTSTQRILRGKAGGPSEIGKLWRALAQQATWLIKLTKRFKESRNRSKARNRMTKMLTRWIIGYRLNRSIKIHKKDRLRSSQFTAQGSSHRDKLVLQGRVR